MAAEEREVLLTGSGGNGKSTAPLLAALADVDRPGYRALLVQRTLAGPVALAERIREWLEPTSAQWDSGARVWRFRSGASLDFGHERLLHLAGEYRCVAGALATWAWPRRCGDTGRSPADYSTLG